MHITSHHSELIYSPDHIFKDVEKKYLFRYKGNSSDAVCIHKTILELRKKEKEFVPNYGPLTLSARIQIWDPNYQSRYDRDHYTA